MIPFDGWRAVGRAMRWARQQDGVTGPRTALENSEPPTLIELIWTHDDGRSVEISWPTGKREVWVEVKRKAQPGRPVDVARLVDADNADTVLRVLAALDLIPAELAQVYDERDERCTWCHRFGHAADQHPLPKGHPQYDAFYDASDDELAQMVSEALRPGDAR